MKNILKILQYSLFPFAILYDGITKTRNKLHNLHILKTTPTPIFSICVGNLSVGGTGKTPHIEYLIRLLADNYKIATLSRGYGRKTKGFIMADNTSNAEKIGDEPMQFFIKFGNKISVFVGEKRVQAVQKLLQLMPKTEVILLDDAFQHRAISATINILLTDYNNIFYQDYLLPTGRLRESRKGAARADIVIVSKTPSNISEEEKQNIEKNIAIYTKPYTPIFWSSIHYLPLEPLFKSTQIPQSKQVILLTGLANSNSLKKYIEQNYTLLIHIELADHQDYTTTIINSLLESYKNYKKENPIVITTEKDMVKLQNPIFYDLLKEIDLYYLPISIVFSEKDKIEFDALIKNKIV